MKNAEILSMKIERKKLNASYSKNQGFIQQLVRKINNHNQDLKKNLELWGEDKG